MTYAAYVFIIMAPVLDKYAMISAQPNVSFRTCMVEAQKYNETEQPRGSFAVCMPIIKDLD